MIRTNLKKILLTSILIFPLSSQAIDLGKNGKTSEITEIDMRAFMISQASQVDWKTKQKKMVTDKRKWFHDAPATLLPPVSETRTDYFDPSVTLTKDVHYPIYDDKGEIIWYQGYKAGQRVNPLDFVVPSTDFFIFSVNSKKQVEIAKRIHEEYPYKIKLVASEGDFGGLANEMNTSIFYAYKNQFAEPMGIKHTFAYVKAGKDLEGNNRLVLRYFQNETELGEILDEIKQ